LTYAKRYNPELVVDMATLTGSAQRALGDQGIAAMGNAARETMDQLKKCGESVHERLVEFPLWEEYAECLQSDIADLKNEGGKYAGMITAGKFLEHFTAYPYIHLDIAGLAFAEETNNYRGKGGTGTGVRLLFEFLKNY
jgi:leucyl aminopeptidase